MRKTGLFFSLLLLTAITTMLLSACGVETPADISTDYGTEESAISAGQPAEGTMPRGDDVNISAGAYHTCVLKSDGSLACWGQNTFGQSTPPAGTFIAVSAGSYHTCGLKSDSSAACWGHNDFGQSVPPSETFKAISAGGFHNCGLKPDGSLACWGAE